MTGIQERDLILHYFSSTNPIRITMEGKITLINLNGVIVPVSSREELEELRENLNDMNR